MKMFISFLDDKHECCFIVTKNKHVRSYPSFNIKYNIIKSNQALFSNLYAYKHVIRDEINILGKSVEKS